MGALSQHGVVGGVAASTIFGRLDTVVPSAISHLMPSRLSADRNGSAIGDAGRLLHPRQSGPQRSLNGAPLLIHRYSIGDNDDLFRAAGIQFDRHDHTQQIRRVEVSIVLRRPGNISFRQCASRRGGRRKSNTAFLAPCDHCSNGSTQCPRPLPGSRARSCRAPQTLGTDGSCQHRSARNSVSHAVKSKLPDSLGKRRWHETISGRSSFSLNGIGPIRCVRRAAEAHVAGRAVGRVGAAGCDTVAVAVRIVAEVRAAPDDTAHSGGRPNGIAGGGRWG